MSRFPEKEVEIAALAERLWCGLLDNHSMYPKPAEGMPNVLFEAMLLGIPCIATDIPVVSDIVSHKINVWMVKAGSRASLTSGIREKVPVSFSAKAISQSRAAICRHYFSCGCGNIIILLILGFI